MNLATTGMPAQKQAGKKRGRGSVATESVAGTKGDGAEGAEDERESSEAWATWEKEMQQYPGWEQGGGQPAHQSGPVSAVKDELTSVLLEDMDCRASILATMVEAGLPAATVREIFASHVRLFTADLGAGPAAGEQWRVDGNGMTRRHLAISRTSEACGVRALARKRCGESCNDARLINTVCVCTCIGEGRMRVYLAHDEERNLHVNVFGWCRFRKEDIAFILRAAGTGPFVEMGAGSGWLAFLLRHAGAEVKAYDLQALDGATFVPGWRAWPWSASVQKGSAEQLEAKTSAASTLLLCWPDLGSLFANTCLEAFDLHGGRRVVYIGEGRGGETAESKFFDSLDRNWLLQESAALAHRGLERDFIYVYSRKSRP